MAGKATKAKGPSKSVSGLAKFAAAKKAPRSKETTSEDAMLGAASREAYEREQKAKEEKQHEEKKAAGGYEKTAGEKAFEARMRGEAPPEAAPEVESEAQKKKREHRAIRDEHEKKADEALAKGDKAAAEEHQHAAHLHDVASRHHAYGWTGKEKASEEAHAQTKIVNSGGSSKSPPRDPDEQADYHRGELDKLKAKMHHGGDKSPETKAAYDKHVEALDKLREGGAKVQKEDRGTETGPRGGKFYISASGEKVYVK